MGTYGQKKFTEFTELREMAMHILRDRARERKVCLRVQALMNSEDTLSVEQVFAELRALTKGGMSFTDVFAVVSSS